MFKRSATWTLLFSAAPRVAPCLALCVAFCVALCAAGGCGKSTPPAESQGGGASNRAPDSPTSSAAASDSATAPDSGAAPVLPIKAISLAEYEEVIASHQGKVVVVDFWGTWCEPCMERLPHMVELAAQFDRQQVVFLTLALDGADDHAKAERFLTKIHASELENYRAGVIKTIADVQLAFNEFDIDSAPFYKIYDPSGALIYQFSVTPGGDVLHADTLDLKLRELLAAAPAGAKTETP